MRSRTLRLARECVQGLEVFKLRSQEEVVPTRDQQGGGQRRRERQVDRVPIFVLAVSLDPFSKPGYLAQSHPIPFA